MGRGAKMFLATQTPAQGAPAPAAPAQVKNADLRVELAKVAPIFTGNNLVDNGTRPKAQELVNKED